jgi:hypothetical protein
LFTHAEHSTPNEAKKLDVRMIVTPISNWPTPRIRARDTPPIWSRALEAVTIPNYSPVFRSHLENIATGGFSWEKNSQGQVIAEEVQLLC